MKKLFVALLVFVLVAPTVVASGPSPQGPPPPRGPLPPPGGRSVVLGDTALDLADQPVPEELASMELSFEKRDKGHEFVRSLTDEQRASIGQLLAGNPMSVLGKVGDPVPSIQSAGELGRQAEAMKALLPEMNRWQDAVEAGLAEILTPEQYALFQDSLLPAPVQMADAGPQAESDCYYAYLYGYYAYYYGYYYYYYAYLTYAEAYGYGVYASYESYMMAYSAYSYAYPNYLYAYYAYYYYPNGETYCYYAWLYSLSGSMVASAGYNLAYDIYDLRGTDDSYYAYLYGYYTYLYAYYSNYYCEYCCPLY